MSVSGRTSGSRCPPPPVPRAHPQHAALAADARRPVLIVSLDGLGAVDYVRAVHQDLGGGLHRSELWAKAGERKPSARRHTLHPRTGPHSPALSGLGLRRRRRARDTRSQGLRRKGPRPRPGHAPAGRNERLGVRGAQDPGGRKQP